MKSFLSILALPQVVDILVIITVPTVNANLATSIHIICRAVVAGQVSCVEASVRLSVLLNQLGVADSERQDFVVFDKMAQAVGHIPILDAWKKLSKEQKRIFEQEIRQQELALSAFVVDAAKRMLEKNW